MVAKLRRVAKLPHRFSRQKWVRTKHEDECRRCHATIVWWIWVPRFPGIVPEQAPRTLCHYCLCMAFTRRVA
jgi:hypothetical protein